MRRRTAEFLVTEAAGGALLVLATIVALGWANSPSRASYPSVWTASRRSVVNEG